MLCVCVQGYSRQAAALIQLDRLGDARKVCEEGLQVDPNNQQIKKCLEDIRAKSSEGGRSYAAYCYSCYRKFVCL